MQCPYLSQQGAVAGPQFAEERAPLLAAAGSLLATAGFSLFLLCIVLLNKAVVPFLAQPAARHIQGRRLQQPLCNKTTKLEL